MSAILHGFSINTSGSPRRLAQRDTEAYWRRLLALGGTDINSNDEVQNVQGFLDSAFSILGPEALVIPGRAAQNMGTGAIVLANRAEFRGTLTNGPTWESTGIQQAAATQRIATNHNINFAGQSAFFVAQRTSGFSMGLFGQNTNTSASHPFAFNSNSSGNLSLSYFYPTGTSVTAAGQFVDSAMRGIACAWDLTGGALYRTTAQVASGAWAQAPVSGSQQNNIIIGATFGAAGQDNRGIIACAAFIPRRITLAEHTALYESYKSTLGQGLGLP
jgi:hypothetical protein